MTESSKSRLALDLDEIERQLRHSSQQPGSSRSDPLAELARIVGQDDPFGALLARETTALRGDAGMDDIFVRREPLFDAGYGPGGPASHGMRGSPQHAQPAPAPTYQDFAATLTSEEEAILRGQHDSHRAVSQEPELYYEDELSYAEPESTYGPIGRRRSRKGILAIGAVVGAAVLGTAGVLTLRSGNMAGVAHGEPPVVKAETGPSKVAPQNPGGVDIPNQNKQIYERVSQDTQTRVVNREEQPVDVRQATRSSGSLAEGPAGSGSARLSPAPPPGTSVTAGISPLQGASNSATGGLGEPRRVRTVSIRPDGTPAIPDQGLNSRPAPPPPSPIGAPRTDSAALAALASSAAGSAPATQAPQAKTAPPVQRPREVTSTSVAPRAAPGPAVPDQATGAPMQITSEAVRQKSDARLAAVPQAIMREPTETAATPTPSGFSVQLGVRNTEREARAMFDQLQQRFAGDLSGHSPVVRQAEINGKTAYRLRVGPLSREDAASLCSRLKASGGQCFVANN